MVLLDQVWFKSYRKPTRARLFYAVAAAENHLVFGADVSNAFAEAPPPQTGILHQAGLCIHGMVGKP